MLHAPLIHRLDVAGLEVVSEVRLLRDHDAIFSHGLHGLVGWHDGEVIQEPAVVLRPRNTRANRLRISINGLHDGRIADRVQTHLPAEGTCRIHQFLKLGVGVAALAAITRHVLVVDQRPRGGARESAVDRTLADGPEAQPIIAVACLVRERFETLCTGIVDVERHARQVRAMLVIDFAPALVSGPWAGILDASCAYRLIVDGTARLHDAGDTERQELLETVDIARPELVVRVLGNVLVVKVAALTDDAIRLTLRILLDDPGLGIRSLARDARDLQRQRVSDRRMSSCARQHDRIIWSSRIQIRLDQIALLLE